MQRNQLLHFSKKRKSISQPSAIFLLLCTLPTFCLTIYFIVVPTIRAFILSFTDSTMLGMGRKNFVGFENYLYMFKDENFQLAMSNTLKLMIVVPTITILISLILAFIITQCKLKERSLYRTLYFFPSIISLTVVGITWSFFFHPNMGILNSIMKAMGLSSFIKTWLGDSQTALWCIAVTLVWQAVGYYMVMHIAAMDGISNELYEAAVIDGASEFDKLFRITLPLIKNIIAITFVLSLSGTLGLSYPLVSVMTGGGPNGASNVILRYIYNIGMVTGSFGYAMAVTVVTTAFSVLLSIASQKLTNYQNKEEI